MLSDVLGDCLQPLKSAALVGRGHATMACYVGLAVARRHTKMLLIGATVVYVVYKGVPTAYRRVGYAKKRARKRRERDEKIALLRQQLQRNCAVDVEERRRICSLPAEKLRAAIKSGKLRPIDVLHSYQWKALEVHEKTNCLVEPILEAEEFLRNAPKDGPLYGMPCSLKDNYPIKGYDCSIGAALFAERPAQQDCAIVTIIKKAGAIPFVKTNVPQTMFSIESTNPIYGMTRNNFDLTRGVGGSSGGEGCLLAGHGSILGVGSDIGGSLRLPAHMNGICSLKPTIGRITAVGMENFFERQKCVSSVKGPMSRDVGGLVMLTRAMLSDEQYRLDPQLPPLGFNDQLFERKEPLRIGFYTYDGYFTAQSACVRAVEETTSALQRCGHTLIEVDVSALVSRCMAPYFAALMADGGHQLQSALCDDAKDASMRDVMLAIALPEWLRRLAGLLAVMAFPKWRIKDVLKAFAGFSSADEYNKIVRRTDALREEFMDLWRDLRIDVIIAPGFGTTAMKAGDAAHVLGAISYLAFYNFMNLPSGSVPVTEVSTTDSAAMQDYPTPDPWHILAKKTCEGSEGMPVNVQVVGRPFQEELVLNVMSQIEHVVGPLNENKQI